MKRGTLKRITASTERPGGVQRVVPCQGICASRCGSLLRLFAISLTLLFAAQAFASGNRAMLCRYSGKIMEDCPCPPAPEHSELERESCCEIRTSTPFTPVGLVRSLGEVALVLELAVTPAVVQEASFVSAETATPQLLAQAPPGERERFLKTRLLLI